MTKRRTTLIQKDPNKETTPNNYRPTNCLPMMWKILTAQISENIYYSLLSHGLYPEELKGCCKGSWVRAELLNIDKHILNDSKTTQKNLIIFWPFDPAKNVIPRWCTGRRGHILMAVMRGNRVGGNWLMKWDEPKHSHGTLIDRCTGREWPVNCMTVISAWWRLNIRFQRSSGRWTII